MIEYLFSFVLRFILGCALKRSWKSRWMSTLMWSWSMYWTFLGRRSWMGLWRCFGCALFGEFHDFRDTRGSSSLWLNQSIVLYSSFLFWICSISLPFIRSHCTGFFLFQSQLDRWWSHWLFGNDWWTNYSSTLFTILASCRTSVFLLIFIVGRTTAATIELFCRERFHLFQWPVCQGCSM